MNNLEKSGLSVFALNPNGIRAYLKKASSDLRKLLKDHSPDVLFFIETKMNSDPKIVKEVNSSLKTIFKEEMGDDYNFYWSHCERPGRHGTGVAVRSTLGVEGLRYNIDQNLEDSIHECEGRCITLHITPTYTPPNSTPPTYTPKSYIFVGLYVVNASQQLKRLEYKEEWNETLANYLEHLKEKYRDSTIFVLGDLNVANDCCDIANPQSNTSSAGFTKKERDQFKALLNLGWVDVWRDKHPIENPDKSLGNEGVYTFWNTKSRARSRNAGWRIDYVLCESNAYHNVRDGLTPYILNDISGSDHCPVGFKLKF